MISHITWTLFGKLLKEKMKTLLKRLIHINFHRKQDIEMEYYQRKANIT